MLRLSSTAKLEDLAMVATQEMYTLMLSNTDCTTLPACSTLHSTFKASFASQLMFAVTAKDPLQLKETQAWKTALQLKI